MDIHYFKTKEEATAAAGETLNNLLGENKTTPILLLLSGGSAFGLLEYISARVLGENLTVSVLDERFSQDPTINNFLQLQKLQFYTDAIEKGTSFFGTLPRPGEKIESLSERWSKNLINWLIQNPKGKIFITLGMGNDGHTAGIFPNNDAKIFDQKFNSSELVCAYNTGPITPHNLRLTSTFTLLKKAAHTLAIICGKEKASKLKETQNNSKLNQLPAAIFKQLSPCELFTDIEMV